MQDLWNASAFLNKHPATMKWPFELAARTYRTLDITRFPAEQRMQMIDLMLPHLGRALFWHMKDHRLLAIVLSAVEHITQLNDNPDDRDAECDELALYLFNNMYGPISPLPDTTSFVQLFQDLLMQHLGICMLRLVRRIMYNIEALSMHDTAFDELMTCLLYMDLAETCYHVQSNAAVNILLSKGYVEELAQRASGVALMSKHQQETCMARMLPLALELLGILEVREFSQEVKGTLYNSLKRMVWVCTEGTTWPTDEDREQSWIKQMVRENVERTRERHGESPFMALVCNDLEGSRAV